MGLKEAREGSLKGEERVRDFRQKMEKEWEDRGVGEEREENYMKCRREIMESRKPALKPHFILSPAVKP